MSERSADLNTLEIRPIQYGSARILSAAEEGNALSSIPFDASAIARAPGANDAAVVLVLMDWLIPFQPTFCVPISGELSLTHSAPQQQNKISSIHKIESSLVKSPRRYGSIPSGLFASTVGMSINQISQPDILSMNREKS